MVKTLGLLQRRAGFQRDLVNSRALRSSHQAAKSDGDIYRFLRVEQRANRQTAAQALRLQLSPCKEKILNQLLRREPPEGCKESVVDALDSLLPYPGVWEGLELANWHRYLALHWDEPIIHYLQNHLRSTYDCIVRGVAGAQQYFDLKAVRNLALRCPQSKSDALFIRKSMEDGELFHGLTDPASRSQILNNILSINIIIPSLKTFHENMKYFAIGAKILRQHILSEDDAKEQPRSFAQRLQWSEPPHVRVETGSGSFITLKRLDPRLALKVLFLIAIKLFPYVSDDRPKKDVRGEKVMEPTVDEGFVYLLRREARRLGFSSPKIEEALAGKQPVCCKQFHVADPQVGAKWRCGKPGLRAFLHLYKHAFLPTLGSVNGKNGLVPMFVARDFLDAFFGPDIFADGTFMGDADVSRPNSASITLEQPTDVDMSDTPHPTSPTQQQQKTATDLNTADTGLSVSRSKFRLKGASRHSAARRWQPYSRERPTEAGPSSNQRRSARPKRSRYTARESAAREAAARDATPQEAGVEVEVPGSPIEVTGRNASRRSPVAPPEADPSTLRPTFQSKGVSRHRPARRWQPYSRERPTEAGPSLNQRISARPKRSRYTAREATPQEATSQEATSQEEGVEVEAPGSPIEVAGQNASRRSPVAPPEPNTVPTKASKVSQNLTVFTPATPDLVDKRKRKAAQSEPEPSFRDLVFGTGGIYKRPLKRFKRQYVDERKRKAAQTETMLSLREWISGTERTNEPPLKRLKNQHMRTSTANVAPEGIPSTQVVTAGGQTIPATSDPQIIMPDHASANLSLRQRSSVAAPNSDPGSPAPTPQSEPEIGHETEPSIEEQPAPQAHSLEQESAEQEFHEIETFAETRTQSPGLTYIDEDWGTSYRSPIATPESEL